MKEWPRDGWMRIAAVAATLISAAFFLQISLLLPGFKNAAATSRLVSIAPMPAAAGEMCHRLPASAQSALRIFAAVRGTTDSDDKSHVAVWSIQDSGNVRPRWTIGGPNGLLRQPRGVTLDPKNKTVIVSNKYFNTVLS